MTSTKITRLSEEDQMEIRNAVVEALWATGSSPTMEELEDRIPIERKSQAISMFTAIRDDLLTTHPAMAQPLMRMQIVVSDITTTICTDGKKLYIGDSWWMEREPRELRHTAAFLGLTITMDAINRGKAIEGLDYERWQYAVNLVINRLLVDQGVGVLPNVGAFMTQITSRDSFEDVYARLMLLTHEELINAMFPTLNQRISITDLLA
jgi:hypothetical protein